MEKLLDKKAPDFSLSDQDGKIHKLSDYSDKLVLLYFYPKDMTSGCTTEAQCFRDRINDLKKFGVQVLGVSPDGIDSHKKFTEKEHLNFPILSDPDKKVIESYHVWKEKSMYGKKYMGVSRESFLIKDGKILKHYEKVKPQEHAEEVIHDVISL